MVLDEKRRHRIEQRLHEERERLFGICENTGESIPRERLELVPWTRTCVAADAIQ